MKLSDKVTVTLGNLSFDVDPAAHWIDLQRSSFSDQLEAVADDMHWLIALHDIKLDSAAKDRFWSAYREPAAATERDKAIHGLRRVNHQAELDFLNGALIAEDLRASAAARGNAQEAMMPLVGTAMEIIKLIQQRDHRAFTRMAAILKAGGTPESEKPRGGEGSELGEMFREFVQLHINSRGLPTKKQLREACGIGGDDDEMEAARRMMKTLGLSGLPESRATPS